MTVAQTRMMVMEMERRVNMIETWEVTSLGLVVIGGNKGGKGGIKSVPQGSPCALGWWSCLWHAGNTGEASESGVKSMSWFAVVEVTRTLKKM